MRGYGATLPPASAPARAWGAESLTRPMPLPREVRIPPNSIGGPVRHRATRGSRALASGWLLCFEEPCATPLPPEEPRMYALSALLVGLLFGLGLIVSRMAGPAKVLAFLDLAGDRDPSLALVMVGAIAIGLIGFTMASRRSSSLLGAPMRLARIRTPDAGGGREPLHLRATAARGHAARRACRWPRIPAPARAARRTHRQPGARNDAARGSAAAPRGGLLPQRPALRGAVRHGQEHACGWLSAQ